MLKAYRILLLVVSGALTSGVFAQTCSFTLASAYTGYDAHGGIGSVQLTASNPSCAWSATSSAPGWLQVFPSTGVGSGPVRFTAFPTFGTIPRSATITVGGQTFTVFEYGDGESREFRFIELLYFNFLGRFPTEEEEDFQIEQGLKPPATFADLAYNFFNTEEFNLGGRFIAGLYVGLLNRDAEYAGWLFQRNAMVTGSTQQSALVSAFLGSQEFMLKNPNLSNSAFVTLLYNQVLGRTPSPSEVTFQASQLTDAASRTRLAAAFLNSPEFRNGKNARLTAFLLYVTLLFREPNPSELAFRAMQISGGTPLKQLVQEFLATAEFQAILQ